MHVSICAICQLAIIIDVEQHCIDRLSKLLTENFKDVIKLTGAFTTVGEGITQIKKIKPALVFLDVEIKDKTGFDLLQQL